MSTACDFLVFDADSHMYETTDALRKFLPRRYHGAIDYVEVRGRTKIAVRGQITEYIPNPTFEMVARPGAQEGYFRHGNPEGKNLRDIFGQQMRALPAFSEPGPRLELMDEQGVDTTMMYPTLASLVEERMRDDPELTLAVIHAFNEWMYEAWHFNYQDRIFSTPVISLTIVDRAIEELEWVVQRGARAVLIRPAPVPGYRGPRSFGLPEFDPFWNKVVEYGTLIVLHSSDSGYDRYFNEWLGSDQEMLPYEPDPFRQLWWWRPAPDAVSAMVCLGALSRFPALKVAVVENGAVWLGLLLDRLAYSYKKMPHLFLDDPVEVVRRNIYISPFWDEDIGSVIELIGADHVLFGSDYPHPEGLAEPVSYVNELDGLSEDIVRKVMGENLARLMQPEAAHA